MSDKPHKGVIKNWHKKDHGGFSVILGTTGDRDEFWIRTSAIVNHDEATGEVETRNSRYTLV